MHFYRDQICEAFAHALLTLMRAGGAVRRVPAYPCDWVQGGQGGAAGLHLHPGTASHLGQGILCLTCA